MISTDEAIKIMEGCLEPVDDSIQVSVWHAIGSVTAKPVLAPADYPPSPRAGYDGYAVRSSDTPGKLRLSGHITVGSRPCGRLNPDEAIYVTTGALLPEDADAIIPQEKAHIVDEGDVHFLIVDEHVGRWSYVDPPGYHCRKGDVLVDEGRLMTALDVVALASVGVGSVRVKRKVKVFSLSVGSELIERSTARDLGLLVADGEVVESNSLLLEWLLKMRTPFATLSGRRIVRDDPGEIIDAALSALKGVDVLVAFGGSGPSKVDYTGRLLDLGSCSVDGIKMKPGKPIKLAAYKGKLMALLPGHPVSTLHALTRLLDPLLQLIAGIRGPRPWPSVRASLADELPERKLGFVQQYPAILEEKDGRVIVHPIYKHGTGVTTKLLSINGLLNLCEDCDPVPGSDVDVALIG